MKERNGEERQKHIAGERKEGRKEEGESGSSSIESDQESGSSSDRL